MASNRSKETTESVDKRRKKREDRSFNLILKTTESLETPEEKLHSVARQYAELFEENRQKKESINELNKRLNGITREKEHLQSDNSKLVLARDKLESLCRELQKANKAVKDESASVTRANEEHRQEVSKTFQTKISEIHTQLEKYHEQNLKLRDENDTLSGKLKEFITQFEQRSSEMETILSAKDTEKHLLQTKLTKALQEVEEMKTKYEQQICKLIAEVDIYEKHVATLNEREKRLTEQNDLYKAKYDEFHKTMAQSSEIYTTCREELEKMAKRCRQMEKDKLDWKKKCESSNLAVLKFAQEKLEYEKVIKQLQTKNETLQNLCRTLRSPVYHTPPSQPECPVELDEKWNVKGIAKMEIKNGDVDDHSNDSPVDSANNETNPTMIHGKDTKEEWTEHCSIPDESPSDPKHSVDSHECQDHVENGTLTTDSSVIAQ